MNVNKVFIGILILLINKLCQMGIQFLKYFFYNTEKKADLSHTSGGCDTCLKSQNTAHLLVTSLIDSVFPVCTVLLILNSETV